MAVAGTSIQATLSLGAATDVVLGGWLHRCPQLRAFRALSVRIPLHFQHLATGAHGGHTL